LGKSVYKYLISHFNWFSNCSYDLECKFARLGKIYDVFTVSEFGLLIFGILDTTSKNILGYIGYYILNFHMLSSH